MVVTEPRLSAVITVTTIETERCSLLLVTLCEEGLDTLFLMVAAAIWESRSQTLLRTSISSILVNIHLSTRRLINHG